MVVFVCSCLAGAISFILDSLLSEFTKKYRKNKMNWLRITVLSFVIILSMIF